MKTAAPTRQVMKTEMNEYEPHIIVTEDGDDFAAASARIFCEAARPLKNPLVILPTGNTPLGMYRCLARDYRNENFWNNFTYVALDEYIGLEDGDPRLFGSWVQRELLDFVAVARDRRITFKSNPHDKGAECARMENFLTENGPADLAVLGLGVNGHIGFNEPGSAFDSRTRVVNLAPETITANSKYWGGEEHVPRTAFTMGLGTLAQARRTVMLVSGMHKADILEKTLTAPISEDIPSTYLRTIPNVTIISDRSAAP